MTDPVRVIALGGTGEIGRNMYVVEHQGRLVVIDCGVSFPKPDQLGVDLVLPDFSYVEERADRLEAVILTHGHEDHIGALPYLLRALGTTRVLGPRFALGLVRAKLDEHRVLEHAQLIEVEAGPGPELGPFRTEFIPLTHSIPDCLAVALHTSVGTIVHTGDFKFDHTPVAGAPAADIPDAGAARRRGGHPPARGLDQRRGAAGAADRTIGRPADAAGHGDVPRAGHRHDLQLTHPPDPAGHGSGIRGWPRGRAGRAVDGAQCGHRDQPAVPAYAARDAPAPQRPEEYRPDEQVIICTGSQGEPLAALSRMARGEHHQVTIQPSDTIIYSSRTVPGNELAVNDTINRLTRIGATVITSKSDPRIHVSGHGTSGDLLWMLQLLRPTYFAPIHGERRHQRAHGDLARSLGTLADNIFMLDNGDVLEIAADHAAVVDHVAAGVTYVDGTGVGDVGDEVLRDRRHLADDGVIVIVASIESDTGRLIGEPEIITRGLSFADDELVELARLEIERSVSESSSNRVTEMSVLQHQLHDVVASVVRRQSGHRPMVLPVIVEA